MILSCTLQNASCLLGSLQRSQKAMASQPRHHIRDLFLQLRLHFINCSNNRCPVSNAKKYRRKKYQVLILKDYKHLQVHVKCMLHDVKDVQSLTKLLHVSCSLFNPAPPVCKVAQLETLEYCLRQLLLANSHRIT